MKRFITYIYEYKNGQKCSNAGFMKVDWRKEQCRLEIHIRNLSVKQEQVKCYWVVKQNQTPLGILWGEIAIAQGKGDGQISFSRQAGNLNFGMEEVIGIAIKGAQTGYLATSWVDEPGIEFLYGTFALEQKKECQEDALRVAEKDFSESLTEPSGENPDEIRWNEPWFILGNEPGEPSIQDPQPCPMQPEEPRPEPMREPRPEPKPEPRPEPKPELRPEPKPELRPEPRPEPMPEPRPEPETMQSQERSQRTEQKSKSPAIRRIDINDIRTLPSANWYLCNNSFLIHGYFNYKYLVIKEIEENGRKKSYLGVPGIFERPERTMALLFGFPKFESEKTALQGKTDIPVMAVSEEKQDIPDGTFGYWFCLLDM